MSRRSKHNLSRAKDLSERVPVERTRELYLENLTLAEIADTLNAEGADRVLPDHVASVLKWLGYPTNRGGRPRSA